MGEPGHDKHQAERPLAAAAAEARFLLGRGYGREKVLALVSGHNRLDEMDRRALRRGVYAPDVAGARRARLLGAPDLAGADVALDGHNVLITLAAALNGSRLVLADDGVVRDLGELGKNRLPLPALEPAAAWLLEAAAGLKPARLFFYLDAPLPRSGELAARLRAMLAAAGLAGGAQALSPPEPALAAHAGPVASSDSVVLDTAAMPVDLAGLLIRARRPAPALERL